MNKKRNNAVCLTLIVNNCFDTSLVRAITEAPRSKRIFITSRLPHDAASCKGVTPPHREPPRSSIEAPLSSKSRTISGNPRLHASCRGSQPQ